MRSATLIFALLCTAAGASAETITVSAAASLKEAIDATCKAFEAKTGNHVELNFAASGPLESQIEHGAPVDAFVSAANEPIDKLIKLGLVDSNTRQLIARNELVLIAPAREVRAAKSPKSFEELLDAKVRRIAIGQPDTVPAGMYAKQTLTSLKLFDRLTPKLVYGASVRQVLAYATLDEVDAALVYATDARQVGQEVHIVQVADPKSHEPIEYPAVVIKTSSHAPVAKALIAFLISTTGQQLLAGLGFETVNPPR